MTGKTSQNRGADPGAHCQALLEVMRNRLTTRQFDPACVVPREHYDLILEAARHAPSGANAQPWHYIIVTDPETKKKIGDDDVMPGLRIRARRRMARMRNPGITSSSPIRKPRKRSPTISSRSSAAAPSS